MSNDCRSSATDVVDITSLSLLERAKNQEEDAWRRIIRLYGPLVYQWCRDLHASPHDAADIVQDVFLKVSQSLGSFRRDRDGYGFRRWLRTVTKHKTIDHFRRQKKQLAAVGGSVVADQLASLTDPPEESQVHESTSLAHRAVIIARDLFEDHIWQAFWCTAIEGRSPSDVADELGVNVCVVYQARSRVLRRLRRDLHGMLDLPSDR